MRPRPARRGRSVAVSTPPPPESLAIHEGIADLVAVLMALRSGGLRQQVLAANDNDIANATVFSSIAEQFGSARPRPDEPHPHALRDLRNDDTMKSVGRANPHRLSTVLSAVFYDFLVDVYEQVKVAASTPLPGQPARKLTPPPTSRSVRPRSSSAGCCSAASTISRRAT